MAIESRFGQVVKWSCSLLTTRTSTLLKPRTILSMKELPLTSSASNSRHLSTIGFVDNHRLNKGAWSHGQITRRFSRSAALKFGISDVHDSRNHSSSKTKYTFDPELGAEKDPRNLKEEISTVNEAAIFHHFNPKGRRLPRV